ncbi:nucleic acid-binding protein [haloarchaeon 3A1-DGR]|nr:nucleic acid-binding protein [haloarchaeon 3A1-DGR]
MSDASGDAGGTDATDDADGTGTEDGTTTGPVRNTGYDEWLDAVADGEGYALTCPNGHASLPPRRVCPDCGAADLSETALPAAGTVETFTVVHVGTPAFADETPYVTAIADFGPVRLTGLVRGIDPEAEADAEERAGPGTGAPETGAAAEEQGDPEPIGIGDPVEASVERRPNGDRTLVFDPVEVDPIEE